MTGAVPGFVIVAAVAFAVAIGAFMLIPLLVVIASSVSGSEFLVFPPRGLSLRWYAQVVQSDAYLAAGWTSLKLAFITVVLSLTLGTAAAIALTRFAVPGKAFLASLFLSPLILPSLIFAIGLLMVFSRYGDGPSFAGLVVGHTVITIPYVIRTVAGQPRRHGPPPGRSRPHDGRALVAALRPRHPAAVPDRHGGGRLLRLQHLV